MEGLSIFDTAIRTGIFQTFTRLVEGSVVEQELRGKNFYTLFAPVDIAFAYLAPETLNDLLSAEKQGVLSEVLGYHAIEQKIMSYELLNLCSAKTLCGEEIVITNDVELRVNGAKILHFDIVARNGVIHGIDRLLFPQKKVASASV